MARNQQLIRQHKILQILERYRFGRLLEEIRDELVKELGLPALHARSVRRDLQALQAAGIDVDAHDSPRGRVWKLGPRAKGVQNIPVSASELIALSLSRDLLLPLVGTPFWQGIESFWHKLQEVLPDSLWRHYARYRQMLYVRGGPAKSYDAQRGVLSTLHRAIMQHRVVRIEYQPIGKAIQPRRIEPYAVVFYQSSLYIVAADHESPDGQNRLRHWKLDRFRRAETADQYFQVPDDFDLEQHLGRSLGIFAGGEPKRFRIRVSAYAAPWVLEDPWSDRQKVDRQPDGGIVLTVDAAHELEILPRVLALGGEAEVLEPASCRQAIAAALQRMAAMYPPAEDSG